MTTEESSDQLDLALERLPASAMGVSVFLRASSPYDDELEFDAIALKFRLLLLTIAEEPMVCLSVLLKPLLLLVLLLLLTTTLYLPPPVPLP